MIQIIVSSNQYNYIGVKSVMKNYFDFLATGDLIKDIKGYFFKYGKHDTYEHTLDVVNELYSMEKQFGRIEPGSLMACYCHDLGRVVGNDEIVDFCIEHNIEVFLADKLSWKEFEYKKLIQEMKEMMKLSKESAIFCYLSDLYNNREKLKVYHLDTKEAFEYFNEEYKID